MIMNLFLKIILFYHLQVSQLILLVNFNLLI